MTEPLEPQNAVRSHLDIDLHEIASHRKLKVMSSRSSMIREGAPYEYLTLWLTPDGEKDPTAAISISIVDGKLVVRVDSEDKIFERVSRMKKLPQWMSAILIKQGVVTPGEDGSSTIEYMGRTYLAKEEDGETIVYWN